ncbi:MAG: outer membrane beta-barrel domain-containing protein [Bacillota bacterium]
MLNRKLMTLLILSSLSMSGIAKAQAQADGSGDDLDVIEMEMEKSAPKKQQSPEASTAVGDDSAKDNTMKDFQGLTGLAPFKEISIIQKRFMPKTGRFELFGGGTIVTNDPFFNTIGGTIKLGYFLSETWGVELNYFGLTTTERDATKELQDIQNVATESLAYPKSYMGVDIMWAPIYGKMTWFNDRIIPFDLYFSGGYGTTNTSSGENAGTIHVATGQIFSLTKSVAFRWDFSWNFFNASFVNSSTHVKETNSFNNLFLTVGMSWFFPEATYR